jgi:hypothetical protein
MNPEASANVAIIASRESAAVLVRCIEAAAQAASRTHAFIDVIVNGNAALAEDAAARLGAGMPDRDAPPLRLWSIELADKANAWNWYVHHIWSPAASTFFVDGYVQPRPDAFVALERAVREQPDALAATGVPTHGRSARRLRELALRIGGLHGNLHLLSQPAMLLLRGRGFRLPVGLYRTDSTLGAALSFGMDPASTPWSPQRFIAVCADATWDRDEGLGWSWATAASYFKRRGRQAQGRLENAAVSHFLGRKKLAPEQLPRTVEELVIAWAKARPGDAQRLTGLSPLAAAAMRRLRSPAERPAADTPPKLLFTRGARADGT